MKLRAVQVFDPKVMSEREKTQLKIVLKSQGLMTKGEEILLNYAGRTHRGEILMEYLSATQQIKETSTPYMPSKYKKMYGRRGVLISKTADFYSLVPAFKRGDKMKTIPPAYIG